MFRPRTTCSLRAHKRSARPRRSTSQSEFSVAALQSVPDNELNRVFASGAKPVNLFAQADNEALASQQDAESDDDEGVDVRAASNENKPTSTPMDDEENPF
jgi:hypothetical protein